MEETLIDEYIDKQSLISAVENFTQQHDMKQFSPSQKKYSELIPKKGPGQGEQYAFEVDLDKCTGCKACVTACHNENGLDEDETWRTVGLIQGGTSQNPNIQHVTSACHHCAEPACMKGCPTLAYTKDEVTGIVKHLDDQCFGCQYCILKCPYDVPKYNKKRGIVHKCDMCIDRLNVNQAPACVRACPTGAIRITLVDKVDVKMNSSDYVKIPDAPASNYTYPTTKYKTNKIFPTNMESLDYYRIKPEHPHLPLVFMLVLTQLSVGAFLAEFVTKQFLNPHYLKAFHLFHIPFALGIGMLALASSILHLGRPHLAFRAILGFKTSWLSREIIAFAIFAKLAILYALCYWFEPLEQVLFNVFFSLKPTDVLAMSVIVSGVTGVICSVMVYRDTKRPFWDNHLTTMKFFLTSIILGSAATLLSSVLLGVINFDVSLIYITQHFGTIFCKVIFIATGIKLFLEASIFYYDQGNFTLYNKTAILMLRQLKKYTVWRFICGILGGVFIPFMFLSANGDISSVGILIYSLFIFGFSLAGELLERYLFFRAAVPLKMPGGKVS